MNKITLRDLANHLGLGKSTVQRALAGSPSVKPSTRERVNRAARELGYEHDLYFAALSARRQTRRQSKALVHYFFGNQNDREFTGGVNLAEYFREYGPAFGLEVERVDYRKFPKLDAIPRILCERGSQGFLVGQCDPRLHPALRVVSERVPTICCQRQPELPFHTVRFSVAACVRLCWHKLWDAGYRRIGCAVMRHDPPLLDDHDRMGTALALLEANVPASQRVPPLAAYFHDRPAFTEWLNKHQPEAVIGFYPEHQRWCYDAAGRAIPFVTLHARPDIFAKHVPGSRASIATLSRETLRQMSNLLRHGEAGPPEQVLHFLVEPSWQGDDPPPLSEIASAHQDSSFLGNYG